jgi:hypothetical protein
MRVSWIVASDYVLDPAVSPDDLKVVGPIWGSWRSWRGCETDNVICHDIDKARQLLARAFQSVCNFYLPRKYYQALDRPMGAKWYDGDFQQDVQDIEDIIAMHLASENSDIMLVMGFDLSRSDQPAQHQTVHRQNLIRQIMHDRADIQWVLIDHERELGPDMTNLANVTRDRFENVLKLLI